MKRHANAHTRIVHAILLALGLKSLPPMPMTSKSTLLRAGSVGRWHLVKMISCVQFAYPSSTRPSLVPVQRLQPMKMTLAGVGIILHARRIAAAKTTKVAVEAAMAIRPRRGPSKASLQASIRAVAERIRLKWTLDRPDLYNEQGGLRGFEEFQEPPSSFEPDDRPVGYDD